MATFESIKLKDIKKECTALEDHYNEYVRDLHIELSELILPERGFFRSNEKDPDDLADKYDKIVEDTAGAAAIMLAANMHNGLTPSTTPWYDLEVEDKELAKIQSVKLWLDSVTSLSESRLQKTNFYSQVHLLYLELIVFGTAAMLIEEDFEDTLNFHTYTAGEYFIDHNKKGKVDTLCRVYQDTVRNIVDKFGIENVSERIKRKVEQKDWFSKVKIKHLTKRNRSIDPTKDDNMNMPFISIYFEEQASDEETPLRVSGFEEFPYIVPRWSVAGSGVWGVGCPGMRTLADVKEIQEEKKDFLKASRKTIDPPVTADKDLKGMSNKAGAITFAKSNIQAAKAQATYQINYAFDANLLAQDKAKEAINRNFFTNLFLSLLTFDKTNRTAFEIAQIKQQALSLLGPITERMQSDGLDDVIERTVKVMNRQGQLPPPPDEAIDKEVRITMTSALAQAQKAVTITPIEQTVDMVTRLQGIDENARHKLNTNRVIENVNTLNGAPNDILYTDEEVQAKLQAIVDAEQAQITAERLSQAADGANKLGNTPMDTDNALSRMLPVLQQGGAASAQQ
jgi:hypothetical protein